MAMGCWFVMISRFIQESLKWTINMGSGTLCLIPANEPTLIVKARSTAHILLKTHRHIARGSGQAHLRTAISPSYTGFLHFPFSKFRHCYLSLQSPVSPFPHGTCLLLVSNIYSALDEIYHPLHAPVPRNMTLRKRTVHWELQMTHRILTLINALFQGLIAAPQLVAYRDLTIQDKMSWFSHWACPDAFAITKGILVSFSSTAYLYA